MKIAHLADIQIRAHSRHEEYRESFEHLYQDLNKVKPDRIVLAGDIVHNKTNISPELVEMTSNFFRSLANIAPLDLILGNHDLAMKNMTKMDAITPIVNALSHSRIEFMRDSGVYRINAKFMYVVMSCIDDEATWEEVRGLSKSLDGTKICLWHGTVNGITLDNGTKLESPHDLKMFDGLDYVMLGDIHKTQVLDEEQRIAYPGSYPKQSYGEGLEGGYFLWDIQDKNTHTLNFRKLPTVCPFYTLQLDDSLAVDPNLTYQGGARIRVQCRALSAVERASVSQAIKEYYAPCELKFDEYVRNTQIVVSQDMCIEDVRLASAQYKLIDKFLNDDHLDPLVLKRIEQINRNLGSIQDGHSRRHVKYNIELLSFDNLFSYGEANLLNFTELKGIVGVFGKNKCGKSSLVVDAPLYGMFNTISKDVTKNGDYVNSTKDHGNCQLSIVMGTSKWRIKRSTKIQVSKKGEEKSITDVSFEETQADGKIVDHGGIDRAATDKSIREIFGTAEDYMRTSVAPQFELLGFIQNKATERKKIIGRYFDLEVFDEKYKAANDELKSLKKRLAELPDVDHNSLIEAARENTKKYREQKREKENELEKLAIEREQLARKLWESESKTKDKASALESEAYSRRNTYKHILASVRTTEADIAELQKFDCIINANCCMRRKLDTLNERLARQQDQLAYERGCMDAVLASLAEVREHKPSVNPWFREEYNASLAAEKECNATIRSFEFHIQQAQTQISCLVEQFQKKSMLSQEFQAYHHYVRAMGKDGISFQIISRNLGAINAEIARILSDEVNFEIWLEDEDKEINIYFAEHGQKKRQIEICSGMEKTLAAVAIRAALVSITALPVSNIFVLDEAFTSLDIEYMDVMGRMLNGLRRVFDTVIIICHSDYVKDLCDKIITIDRDDQGYSRISV